MNWNVPATGAVNTPVLTSIAFGKEIALLALVYVRVFQLPEASKFDILQLSTKETIKAISKYIGPK